jgi:hypothetical protein
MLHTVFATKDKHCLICKHSDPIIQYLFCRVKMASAGSIKSLSEDTFVSKACADTLADAPTDVLI